MIILLAIHEEGRQTIAGNVVMERDELESPDGPNKLEAKLRNLVATALAKRADTERP